ncbi:hypothetical protein BHM03_00021819, partial [Ensete ventricosum]
MARVASSHFGLLRELPQPRLDPSDLPRRLRQTTVLRLRSARPLRLPKIACLAESKPVEPPPIESPPEQEEVKGESRGGGLGPEIDLGEVEMVAKESYRAGEEGDEANMA